MKVLYGIALVGLIGYCGFLHYQQKNKMKIGMVTMDDYVYGYNGMKQASAAYSEKTTKWNKQTDSIKQVLEDLYKQIKEDSLQHNIKKEQEDVLKFQTMGNSFLKYKQNISEKAQEEDKNMTLGILNQLDTYMKEFAKENGYDLILTNTKEKSVGYINVENDITQDLIKYANAKFENK